MYSIMIGLVSGSIIVIRTRYSDFDISNGKRPVFLIMGLITAFLLSSKSKKYNQVYRKEVK